MALAHANIGEPWDVRPLGSAIAGARSSALFKSAQLEVIRLVLPAGKGMPEHRVAGEITIHCLEGALAVDALGARRSLVAGELLFLPPGEPHAVEAVEDCSALVTIVLAGPPGAGGA
ncbi:MAG TPA: cupin domain-containing protein [Burkholderiaceae bacterium]